MSICSTASPSVVIGSATATFEGIEVADDQVDRRHAVLDQFRRMFRCGPGQDGAVHCRMQRLHPAAQQVGIPGQVGDRDDRKPGRRDRGGRTATSNEFDAQFM